jgi:O-antigen/teichoic acid export membrane protein/tRNA A-37 threonylcarbamoyl transferase component Bud32
MGGQIIITFFSLGSAVITARALNADGRGQFSLALLLANMLFMFTEFGLGTAGTRLMATGRWPRPEILASHAFAIAVRALVAGLIGLAVVLLARDVFFPGMPVEYLLLGILQILPLMVAGSVLPLLLGLRLAKTYNRILVLSSLLSFGSLSIGWVLIGLSVRTALLLQLGVSFIIAVVIWKKTSQAVGGLARPNFRYLAEAYRFGIGMYASGVLSFANTRLIWLLINNFAGVAAVGLYTIAQVATERIYLVADALGTILFPRIAENPESNSHRITPTVFRIALITGAGLAVVLALVADWLVRFLFTDAFAGSVPVIRLLLVAVVFSSGWRVLSQDLNGRGYSVVTAIVNGAATVLGLGLAFLLLPRLGLEGAAWSAIAAAGMSLLAGVLLFGYYSGASHVASELFVPSVRERQFAARLLRGSVYVMQLGPTFAWALTRAYLLDDLALRLATLVAPFRRRIAEVINWLSTPAQLHRARKLQKLIATRPLANPALQLNELGLDVDNINAIRNARREGDEVILGAFDHYGRLVPAFGPINGMPCISEEQADHRRRAHIWLVMTPRGICVRKQFFGAQAKQRFLRELWALEVLRETAARVPEIVQIDVHKLMLVMTFIGVYLEQVLTTYGARMTGVEIRVRLGTAPTATEIFNEYINEGTRFILELPPGFVESIHQQMRIAHQHGVSLYDIKYGNVAVHYQTGLAYLIDFDAAALSKKTRSRAFLVERDRDTEKFNKAFGTSYLTYNRIRNKLQKGTFPAADKLYASTYIGHGLRVGPLWDRTIGFGRWHFILKHKLRLPNGARVLSLGSNNASIELHLLREGAEEVIAYERDENYAAQGRFLAAACEWADNRKYRLRYVLADMQDTVQAEGKFDCALALCSLYYLPEEEMRKVARAVAKLSPRFLLQCNVREGIGREETDQYRRASVEFAVDLLREAGFSSIAVTAPAGYSRPLVEGNSYNVQ